MGNATSDEARSSAGLKVVFHIAQPGLQPRRAGQEWGAALVRGYGGERK